MSLEDLTYHWVFFWSYVALLAERLWRSFWPAFSVAFVFAGLASLRFFAVLPPVVHLALLLLFALAFGLAAWRLGAVFAVPRAREVRRAIEKQSGLRHRPLEAMTDRPVAVASAATAHLWQKYQERLAKARLNARIHRPRPDVGGHDPYHLRFAALALLLLGIGMAQHETLFRLRNALSPDVSNVIHFAPVALDAWITPPEYTHQNPVFLATTQLGAAAETGPVTVPENSVLKLRLAGYAHPPALKYGDRAYDFTRAADKNFTFEMPLTASGVLKITQWWVRPLGNWSITVAPDVAPAIVLLKTEETKRKALKITYMAKDDYRVKAVTGTIAPTPELLKTFGTRTIDFDLPTPDSGDQEMNEVTDLTAHPWAGAPVILTLTATDDAGHATESAPKTITLPQRVFQNPVAQRIIAERKRLIWYGDRVTQKLVMAALADIASQPSAYNGDLRVFLGLDMAVKRLVYDGSPEAVASLIPFLWDIAVRVEDGGLSLASKELSDSLQKLSEGLKDKSLTKDQIQKLVDDVQQKMREYAKNLANEMQQRMQEGKNMPQISPDIANKIMKHIDMQKMLDQMQQLTQGSEREQMEKMAQYLKNSVDNMDMKKLDQMQQGQKDAMQGLDELQKLIERQQSLLDKTNKLLPKEQQEQNPGEKPEPQKQPEQPQKQSAQEPPQPKPADQPQQAQQKTPEPKPDEKKPEDKKSAEQKQPDQQKSQDGKQAQQQSGQQQDQQQQRDQQGQAQQSGQQSGNPQTGGQHAGNQQPQPGGQSQGGQQRSGQQSAPQPGQGQTAQGQTAQGQNGGQGQAQGQAQSPGQIQGQAQGGQTGAPPQPLPGAGTGGQKPAQNGAGGEQPGQDVQQGATPGEQPNLVPGGDKLPKPQQPDTATQGLPVHSAKDGEQEQYLIRQQLGEAMRKIGENIQQLPDNFTKGDQAMKQSGETLGMGDAKGSMPYQKDALDQLQKGMDKSMQQMADQLQTTIMSFGFLPEGAEKGFGQGFDPLGRNGKPNDNGQPGTDNIKIPDEKERRRVQEIIEELRARSNDYSRPKQERDYIDRLLNQFN